jgi:hypothetical protein
MRGRRDSRYEKQEREFPRLWGVAALARWHYPDHGHEESNSLRVLVEAEVAEGFELENVTRSNLFLESLCWRITQYEFEVILISSFPNN